MQPDSFDIAPLDRGRLRRGLAGGLFLAALLGAGVTQTVDAAPRMQQQLASTTPARKAAPRAKVERRVTLTFSDVDVREVLSQISAYTHSDIVMTPGATGSISISMRGRLPDEAIRLAAAAAGLSVVNRTGIYIVGPALEVQKAVTSFAQSVVVPLRFVTPVEAVAAIARVAPLARSEAAQGGVVIAGLPADLEAARFALREMEAQAAETPANRIGTSIYTFKTADPANGERVLASILPDLKVAKQDRTLIMTGLPANIQVAEQAMRSIDVESPKVPEAQDVLVYKLNYLNAQKAEETLKKAFPSLTVAAAPEANAPPAAIFNPMSGGFPFSGGSGGGGSSGSSGGTSAASSATGGGGGSGSNTQPLSRSTRLILIGAHSDVEAARQVLEQSDVEQPMVRIEAELVEVNSDAVKNLGVNWDLTNTGFTFAMPGGGNLTSGVPVNSTPIQRTPASFTATVQALVTQNKARILSAPNISVVDNEDASIFVGELLRFVGGSAITPGGTTLQATETAPVGIALLVRPRIHPDGNVTLKVHPIVSAIDKLVGGLPQTFSREADTTVRLRPGDELVIGGLYSSQVSTSFQKLPILGDIPVIGELFRSRTKNTTHTDLFLFLRAYPVQARTAPTRDFTKEHK